MSDKRSIFEDVSDGRAKPAPVAAGGAGRDGGRRVALLWLKGLFVLVALIILVGGMTRLTDSGLSITEWAPIRGALPPMSEAAWQVEFEKYQQIPEFQIQNRHMDLAAFKTIYWWEWGHRQLGRFIGLFWAVGFFYLVFRERVARHWGQRFLLLGALGGLQGLVGWWMVSSGLTGRMVDVASYRLAIHLGLAFSILGLIAWYHMGVARGDAEMLQARRRREAGLAGWATILAWVLFLQIVLGALVAGLDAGRGYVDWPMMGGQFFPDGALNLEPAWLNLFENVALTQFNHRMVAYGFVVILAVAWWRSRSSALAATRSWFNMVALIAAVQVVIGIVTVLNAAPVGLASLHQFGAIVLWVLVLGARFNTMYPRIQSLR